MGRREGERFGCVRAEEEKKMQKWTTGRREGLLLFYWGLGLRLCITVMVWRPFPAVLDGLRACLSSCLSWSEANMVGGAWRNSTYH